MIGVNNGYSKKVANIVSIEKMGYGFILNCVLEKITFCITLEFTKIRELESLLKFPEGKQLKTRVKCRFPTFLTSKLKLLYNQANPFEVKVIIKKNVWRVHLYARAFRANIAKEFAERMNSHLFVEDDSLMNSHAEAMAEVKHERKEKIRIFFDILKGSKDHPEWNNAVANIGSILVRSCVPYSLKKINGAKLIGCNLTGIILDQTHVDGVDFSKGNLSNAYIHLTDLKKASGKDVFWGQQSSFIHDTPICGIAQSSNGKYLATVSEAGFVYIWDFEKRQQIYKLPFRTNQSKFDRIVEHSAQFYLAFSKDNRYIAVANSNGEIHIWLLGDFIEGEQVIRFREGAIRCMVPGEGPGQFLVGLQSGRIYLLSPITDEEWRMQPLNYESPMTIGNIAFCSQTKRLGVVDEGGGFTIIDLDGQVIHRKQLTHQGFFNTRFSISSDLKYCVFQGHTRQLNVWDTSLGNIVYTEPEKHIRTPEALFFCFNDTCLTMRTDEGIEIIQLSNGKTYAKLIFGSIHVKDALISQNGDFLMATILNEVKVWPVKEFKEGISSKPQSTQMMFMPGKSQFFFATETGSRKLGYYDYFLKRTSFYPTEVNRESFKGFLKNSSLFAECKQNQLSLKNIEDGQCAFQLKLPNSSEVTHLFFSDDHTRLALKNDESIDLFEVASQKLLYRYPSKKGEKGHLVSSSNLEWLAEIEKEGEIVQYKNKIHLYHFKEKKALDIGSKKAFLGMQFSPDQTKLYVLCTEISEKFGKKTIKEKNISDDGSFLSYSSSRSKFEYIEIKKTDAFELQVWNLAKCKKENNFIFPTPIPEIKNEIPLISLDVSPDGSLIAVEMFEGKLYLISLPQGEIQAIAPFDKVEKLVTVRFSPNNRYLALQGNTGSFLLWKLYDKKNNLRPHLIDRWPNTLVIHKYPS